MVPDDVVLPRLFLAFRSPVFGSDEYYAASVCTAILGLGKASRLYRTLVRDREVATETNAFTFDLSKGADIMVIDALARPEVDAEQLEGEVVTIVDALIRDGVRDEEMERARALVETTFVAAMQSAGDRADRLSMFATYFGDPELANEQLDRYRAVTREQVTEFARARLGKDNRASLVYVPRADGAHGAELAGAGATEGQ